MNALRRMLVLAGTILLCASWSSIFAVGLGTYVKFENDPNVDWTLSYPSYDYTPDEDADGSIRTVGVGFVLDTSPTDAHVFNYRLNAGYERLEGTIDHGLPLGGFVSETFALDGMAVDHTFGFAVFRRDNVRVWLGPQLKVGFYWGNDNYELDSVMTRIGAAFLVGANFQVASHFTIAGTMGLSLSAYAAAQTYPASDPYDSDRDLTATGTLAPNFHLSFLF